MTIKSAKFVKGIVGPDEALGGEIPQVAFIGRSNVGKSSVINSLTGQKDLAITSSFPGRTQQINLFLINDNLYLLDLPGYGFAKASQEDREKLQKLIFWYLFDSTYEQKKIVMIIDANVGLTDSDLKTLGYLQEKGKNVVIVANKSDRMKKTELQKQLQKISIAAKGQKVITYSAKKRIGVNELLNEILN